MRGSTAHAFFQFNNLLDTPISLLTPLIQMILNLIQMVLYGVAKCSTMSCVNMIPPKSLENENFKDTSSVSRDSQFTHLVLLLQNKHVF